MVSKNPKFYKIVVLKLFWLYSILFCDLPGTTIAHACCFTYHIANRKFLKALFQGFSLLTSKFYPPFCVKSQEMWNSLLSQFSYHSV